ncbi:MAG: hypothetical protein AAB971_02335 [Patescibacteria group bacterium]
MKTSLNQSGSTFVALLLGLVVIVVVGVVGYRVVNNTDTGTVSSGPVKSSSNKADGINSAADIKKADSSLDSTSIDSDVDPAQLDSDLNSLL